ncbi:hypothetical protein P8452_48784 [Trifolium repens]|nr:hypothetical protein P8452_32169 [Trifolium repens]WJX63955.1 hypothetical protein P8452_48784 [Trifolium repens]
MTLSIELPLLIQLLILYETSNVCLIIDFVNVWVLHMDRDDYYGGESTSLNLIQLWKKFRGDDKPPPHLGSSKDYNIDMNPKEQWFFINVIESM